MLWFKSKAERPVKGDKPAVCPANSGPQCDIVQRIRDLQAELSKFDYQEIESKRRDCMEIKDYLFGESLCLSPSYYHHSNDRVDGILETYILHGRRMYMIPVEVLDKTIAKLAEYRSNMICIESADSERRKLIEEISTLKQRLGIE